MARAAFHIVSDILYLMDNLVLEPGLSPDKARDALSASIKKILKNDLAELAADEKLRAKS